MKQIHKAGMVMALSLMAANAWADGTLDAVKKKGFVQCGVGDGLPGFSNPDAKGTWTGLDVDVCAATWPPRYWGRQQGPYVSAVEREQIGQFSQPSIQYLFQIGAAHARKLLLLPQTPLPALHVLCHVSVQANIWGASAIYLQASSFITTSRTQCRLFSIAQCPGQLRKLLWCQFC